MTDFNDICVSWRTSIREAMAKIDASGNGIVFLTDDSGKLVRTVTDGDLRRELLNGAELHQKLQLLPAQQPIVVPDGCTRKAALQVMRDNSIQCLPVVDGQQRLVKILNRASLDDQILLSTPHMGSEERDFIDQAFTSNWIAPLGPNVDCFESELAATVGISHAAALSSGTAAIHLALCLLGVGRGDRVFCSTLTFAASANPICYQDAEPVFIDSEKTSWGMCPKALARAFEQAVLEANLPKAVIVVNIYGQSADMDPLKEICDHYGVPIIEDAAESLGATYKGRASGTIGAMGIYSFNGNKIITTSGGGMLISDEEKYIEKARFLATQARDPAPHYQHSEIGYNYRMSNILAGVGRGQLKVLEDRVSARRAVFDSYSSELQNQSFIEWMPEPEWSQSTRWLSAGIIRSSKFRSSDVIEFLDSELIEARPVWKPMHLQPVFAHCSLFSAGNDAVANDFFENGICLPSGSNMNDTQVERVISAIKTFAES